MADDNKIIAEILVEGVDQFKASLKGAQTSVENLNTEVAQTGDVSKQAMTEAAQSTASYRTQLKNMTSDLVGLNLQLAEMKDAGKAGTKEFTDLEKRIESLRKKAGELKDAMMDANDQIKATGSDTAGLDKAIRVVGSASAAFQVFEGAATLAGKGSEDLQKALVRLNGVMAITQGLQQIQNELVRDDSVFKGIATKATALYNIVVGQSTGALKLFRIALVATGIGAAIIAIVALYENWDKLKAAINSSIPTLESYRDAQAQIQTQNEQRLKDIKEEIELRLRLGEITQDQAELETIQALTVQLAEANAELFAQQSIYTSIKNSANETVLGIKKGQEVVNEQLKKQTLIVNEAQKNVDTIGKQLALVEKERADRLKGIYQKQKEDQVNALVQGQLNDRKFAQQRAQFLEQQQKAESAKRLEERRKEIAELKAHRDEIIAILRDRYQKELAERERRNQAQAQRNNVPSAADPLQQQFEKAQNYYGQIQGAITQTSQLISNATQIRAENEIAALDRKRQRGLISEKQYEKEVAKIKNDAAQKQRRAEVVNAFAMIPMAILSAFTNTVAGLPGKFIAAAIAGVFATAQAGLVAAAPLPKFRDGGSVAKRLGLIKGKSHEAGGVPIEVEGDEFVMSKKAVKHYGVDFMDKVNNMKLSPVVTMSPKLEQMKQTDYKLYEHLATLGGYMKQDYRTNETGNRILLNIQETLKRTNTYV